MIAAVLWTVSYLFDNICQYELNQGFKMYAQPSGWFGQGTVYPIPIELRAFYGEHIEGTPTYLFDNAQRYWDGNSIVTEYHDCIAH